MPNWNYTTMYVTSENKEEIARFKKDASKCTYVVEEGWGKGEERWRLFGSLYPMPEEYDNTVKGSSPILVSEEIASQNDGCYNWYDWQLHHWGVKWGDCSTELEMENEHELAFRTDFPWGIPVPALIKISADYPDLVFELDMDEEGGFFHGEMTFQNGEITEDNVKDEPSPDLFGEEEEEEEVE